MGEILHNAEVVFIEFFCDHLRDDDTIYAGYRCHEILKLNDVQDYVKGKDQVEFLHTCAKGHKSYLNKTYPLVRIIGPGNKILWEDTLPYG